MPVLEGINKNKGMGYADSNLRQLAGAFKDLADDAVNEGAEIFGSVRQSFAKPSVDSAFRHFFTENTIDPNENLSLEEMKDESDMMNALYDNDKQSVLEYANIGGYNPVIGISFPMHKLLLMNCIFDNGKAIQKAVAKEPKFTFTMENRYLCTPDGRKLDLSLDQRKLTDAVNSTRPFVPVEINLPENETTDVLAAVGGVAGTDDLSITTHISAIKVEVKYDKGDFDSEGNEITDEGGKVMDDWLPVDIKFTPGYNDYERSAIKKIDLSNTKCTSSTKTDTITATMNKNKFTIFAASGALGTPIIKAVKLTAQKDSSNGLLETATVRWESTTTLEEIPENTPISVAISPNEVKDISALYNIDQLTKVMTMIKDVLINYKDDTIRNGLDKSWDTMPVTQKFRDHFDMTPREGYAFDSPEYRRTGFMDVFESFTTRLIQVLNDPNVTVTAFGRPDIIRKIKPTNITFSTPSSIGPVPLEYERCVCSDSGRVYNFVSSQKLNFKTGDKLEDNNELIVILRPNNTNRCIYRVYDYQMFVSNEIRNVKYYTLPAVYAYERFLFMSYQPVQGRFDIINPTGQVA